MKSLQPTDFHRIEILSRWNSHRFGHASPNFGAITRNARASCAMTDAPTFKRKP